MPLTIKDVAAAAGVSKATVSRVLSGDATSMRAETRQKVQEVIDALGYRPSAVARSLTSRRTCTLGMLISDVANPFYGDVIHGVEDAAFESEYNLLLGNINYDLARGEALVRSFVDRRVDGVLLMSSSMTDAWLEQLARGHVPVVVLDWQVKSPLAGVSTIAVDYSAGIRAAVKHLVDLGHRRFAHVGGPGNLQTSQARRDAFLTALNACGLDAREVILLEANLRIDGGRLAAERLLELEPCPTAVFAANDLTAMGVMSAARAKGLRLPQDLSVVGLDDIWLASEEEPPLTTVALPRYEIGVLSVQMLFDRLDHPEASPRNEVVQTHLVVRGSTARA
jgi:LacI family transcriptional regulator